MNTDPRELISWVNDRDSAAYCVASVFCMLFSHPLMCVKHPSADLASDEKGKAIIIRIMVCVSFGLR